MFASRAVAPTKFQLEFIREVEATIYLWKAKEMRNVDEVVFSRALGECVSDLRHSGWRLDEPEVGAGPCIWGTCAFSGDRKNKDGEPKPRSACLFFLCLN